MRKLRQIIDAEGRASLVPVVKPVELTRSFYVGVKDEGATQVYQALRLKSAAQIESDDGSISIDKGGLIARAFDVETHQTSGPFVGFSKDEQRTKNVRRVYVHEDGQGYDLTSLSTVAEATDQLDGLDFFGSYDQLYAQAVDILDIQNMLFDMHPHTTSEDSVIRAFERISMRLEKLQRSECSSEANPPPAL